ncbi:alkene reductase [Fictibacillus aquaticus]|uniref:Alkene reductase n=1 Tax=Fictibacillus aquaticus TaxID=2021314 RepID=A0A235FA22_9BACL|nr:alkene reductase [Fictibacillus aquaticus]
MDHAYHRLLEPVKAGSWNLRNRICMAPMTRCFADDETGVVGEDVIDYYRKRAADGVGLIITEGIVISSRGKGTFNLPGLFTKAQIEGWQRVTDAVHEEGGTIIAQLWHVGRLTHHQITGGFPPQAPSAIKAIGHVHRFGKPFDMPEEMSLQDIKETILQYRLAARNAMLAGFDGVEVHGAHGYLIDQFNSDISNIRTDQYGGDLAQRLTFMKEVLMAVKQEAGADRTMIRFSALKDDVPDYMWEDSETAIKTFIQVFKEVGIKNLHPSTNHFNQVISNGKTFHQLVRKYWDGIIVGVGNLNPILAGNAVHENTIDLAAFGRPLLANPDFVQRLTENRELKQYDGKKHLSKLL